MKLFSTNCLDFEKFSGSERWKMTTDSIKPGSGWRALKGPSVSLTPASPPPDTFPST